MLYFSYKAVQSAQTLKGEVVTMCMQGKCVSLERAPTLHHGPPYTHLLLIPPLQLCIIPDTLRGM